MGPLIIKKVTRYHGSRYFKKKKKKRISKVKVKHGPSHKWHIFWTYKYSPNLPEYTLEVLPATVKEWHRQSWGLWFHLSDQYHLASLVARVYLLFRVLELVLWKNHEAGLFISSADHHHTALIRHLNISSPFTATYWNMHVRQGWLCNSAESY